MRLTNYLHYLQRVLPTGAEVYLLDPHGTIHCITRGDVRSLRPHTNVNDRQAFLRFIDDGQFTRYLIGDAATSEQHPSNATYKLGSVQAHSAFTPHAHGAEHFVLSQGYASCGLYDWTQQRVVHVRLFPGALLRIPAMMPHSFNNRADDPLLLVIANTGMGIDHEAYAITAAQAEQHAHQHASMESHETFGAVSGHHHNHSLRDTVMTSLTTEIDYSILAQALRHLEHEMQHSKFHVNMTWREHIASQLRRVVWLLEST